MNAVEALCACSAVLNANMQFMELVKLIILASTCITFKCHTLLILELNKTHVRILLWNRSTMMMMYCTNRPKNQK